jgi:predicted Zn-dependent protease
LRYGLAMEFASDGNENQAVEIFRQLIAEEPYVPAFLMAGQMLQRLGRESEAAAILQQGIVAAKAQGNHHALGEMEGFLATL